jgi:SAM-dependent methyltransferase/uncharacterized protein YbaR (Trm112 family)
MLPQRMDPALTELLCCPRCRADLHPADVDYACSGCQTRFPQPGGVVCLMSDPTRALEGWRRDAQRLVELIEQSVASMDEQRSQIDLLASTRGRLDRMRAAHAENARRLGDLFRAADLSPEARSKASERDVSLIEYYEQILRDWAWDHTGGRENQQACDLVAATLGGDTNLGRVLVLGAGPCRLAYDLHTRFGARLTAALDLNPFLLLAARQVLVGGGLRLYEFPADPRGLDTVCVDHELRAPGPAPESFHFVLADGFVPPFRPGSFDTVVTPWFIDVVPRDIRESIPLIHRLLAPGGRWLMYGPLSYPKEHPHAQRYSYEELYDLVRLGAFDLGPPTITTIDYMHSRASARGKTAEVLTFAARKREATSGPPDQDPPAWLLLGHLPIARFPGLASYQPEHPMLGYLAGLIDGKRTLEDLAARMVQDHGARPDAVLAGTRAALSLLWQSARRPRG